MMVITVIALLIQANLVTGLPGEYTFGALDVNGGGTQSTGGSYTITASTAQVGGVGIITGGTYEARDGFWHVVLAGECNVDAHCEDGINCTIDACVSEVCVFTAVDCVGACCFEAGPCLEDVSESNCKGLGGLYLGNELTCEGDPDSDGCEGCADLCPLDPLKCNPGGCGCGNPETGRCPCGIPEVDTDEDGVPDCADDCPGTPVNEPVDFCGCILFGACCSSDGQACVDGVTEETCDLIGNIYQGNGTSCPSCSDQPLRCGPVMPLDPHDRRKNRYLSFMPNLPGQRIKLEITLVGSLPHPALIGASWWVQQPQIPVLGQLPKPLVGPGECVAKLGPESTAAQIDWDAAGCQTLHVTGCPIEPTSAYEVQAVFDTTESAALTVATILKPGVKWWGDTIGIFNGVEWTPPNLITNIDDAVAGIRTFQGGQVVPPGLVPPGNVAHLSVTDVDPGNINMVVNINDVLLVILAFQGNPYPFGPADANGNCP